MNKWNLYSPDGMQDVLGDNCYIKKRTEGRLREMYLLNGFSEIETPMVEYYDVFDSAGSESALKSMYKMVDEKGRILTMRPDMTIPAARAAATKITDGKFPAKLFYCGRCFRSDIKGGGKQREFTESGVEIIGSADPFYDALVINMAVRAMKTAGIEEFIIELGQVDFTERLMELSGLEGSELDLLAKLIDSKDFFGVEELLVGKPVEDNIRKLLLDLPNLYGKAEMLEGVRSRISDKRLMAAIDALIEILSIIEDFGVSEYISVDLGMVKRIDYYTGIIFRGLTYGMGFPVLGGGRYDNLCSSFNKELPATGFSITIDLALAALYRNGVISAGRGRGGTLVSFRAGERSEAITVSEALKEQGIATELYPLPGTEDEDLVYAREWGLDGIVRVLGDGLVETMDIGTGSITKGEIDSLKGGTI
ncbi:MAG TPA: ATP phosphoribosyltransferase regulatory subunit [Clostridia bacterium]|nr:ATP phosphoribosyltransferase regulatory subunit [Clostridia bacterium]